MATTTNLGLTKPTVGGDTDAWGGYLNNDLDYIDAMFSKVSTAVTFHVKNQNISGSSYKLDSIQLGDDRQLKFGDAPDYWFVYDNSNTCFELNSTNVDGGGTDGVVFKVDDGTDDVVFNGNISATQVDILAEGDLRLQDASGGQYVGFDAPATVSGSYTLTLPAAVGSSGQILRTSDASGTLEWVTDQEGDIKSVADATNGGLAVTNGTGPDVTLALDFNDLTAAAVSVANDSIAIIDANDSNATRKESIADLASAMGGTGLTGSSGTLNVDAAQTGITSVGTLSSLTVSGDLTVDTDTLKVDSSNNRVGLGTTSPGTLLELKESSTGAGDDVIRLRGNGNNAKGTDLGAVEWWNADSSGAGVVARVEAVSGNANGHMGELVFKTNDGSSTSEAMRINNSGKVGIGTTSPEELLEVASTSTNEGIQVSCWSSTQSSAGTIRLAHSLSGTVGSHTAVTSGDQLGRIFFAGSDGTDFYSGAAIIADSTQAYTGTNGGTRLEFYTTPNGSQSRSEAMMIDQNGHIGIGTSSPDALLELKESSTAAADAVIRLRGHGNNADNTVLGALEWYNADSSGDQPGVVCRIEGVSGNSNGHMGEILFKTHDGSEGGSGSNPVERMRIDNSGDVGIGTASPSEKLDVVGNVTISGSLSKGSGSFKIDHPLPEMSDTHHLVHSFIEGPKADLIYRGSVALVDGAATVDLDAAATMTSGTWEVLCRDPQVWVQNEDGWTQVRGSISGSTLSIEAQDAACTDTVSWLVVAERKDPNIVGASLTDEEGRVIVEPLKNIET